MRESVVQTQRQRYDVGHEGVITGRDVETAVLEIGINMSIF
ncbi:hypothetical protein ACQKNB_04455 [Lysinibacillus xylanilyticus]